MGRYVVVEFANNDDAQMFINEAALINAQERHDRTPFVRRVVGVFVKPGKVCECAQRERTNYGDKNRPYGISRGARFGWWVCENCNKPRAAGHQLVNQVLASETYEGPEQGGFEFTVTDLGVTGIHVRNIDRPKKLRRKKAKK